MANSTSGQLFYQCLILLCLILWPHDLSAGSKPFELTVEFDVWEAQWRADSDKTIKDQNYEIEPTRLKGFTVTGTTEGRSGIAVSFLTDQIEDNTDAENAHSESSQIITGYLHKNLSAGTQFYTRLLYGYFNGRLTKSNISEIQSVPGIGESDISQIMNFTTKWYTLDMLYATNSGFWVAGGLRLSRYEKPLETEIETIDVDGNVTGTHMETFYAQLTSAQFLFKIMDGTHFGDYDKAKWYFIDTGVAVGFTLLKALDIDMEVDSELRLQFDFDLETGLQYAKKFRYGGMAIRCGFRGMYFGLIGRSSEHSQNNNQEDKGIFEHTDMFYGPYASVAISF